MAKKPKKKTNPQGKVKAGKVPFLQDKKKVAIASLGIVAVIVFLVVGLPLILNAMQNPFVAGDKFSFQINFNQGSGTPGNLQLYYVNTTGMTDEEIQGVVSNDSEFVDYFTIPFAIDGVITELTANDSYLYRYYVQPAGYTGSYGYVAIGENAIYLNLLPTSLNIDVTSLTYSHVLENTTETNWTTTYSQIGYGFNTFYNKTGAENISWVFKFDFDVPALDTFVDVSWFSYENQNTIETIVGNSLYVEIQNYGFEDTQNNLGFKFADTIGSTFNVTRLGIGYGNANNFVELGSHS
jgi:hypothetical protein